MRRGRTLSLVGVAETSPSSGFSGGVLAIRFHFGSGCSRVLTQTAAFKAIYYPSRARACPRTRTRAWALLLRLGGGAAGRVGCAPWASRAPLALPAPVPFALSNVPLCTSHPSCCSAHALTYALARVRFRLFAHGCEAACSAFPRPLSSYKLHTSGDERAKG